MPTASPNPPPTPDDRALMEAALMGSPVAFDRLVERYHAMVYLIGYARLGNRESAEDLAQEVFLRIFLHLRDFDRRYDFAPWIGRIARNLATDWLRRGQSASRLVRMVPLDSSSGHELPDTRTQGAREKMESEERDASVREAVFALPSDQRELVLLHYAEDLSQQDIAARLGVHPATVSRQMRKAMQALRQSIEPVLVDWVKARRPQKQAAIRTLALIGAAAALSAQAKSAVAAAATMGQYAASVKTGAAAAAGTAAGASGLASFLASLGAWIAGGAKVMAFWKTTAVIITGVALVGGAVAYQKANKDLIPKAPVNANQQSTGLKPAPMPEWEEKFWDTYRLRPFDTMKYVAPPLIPERATYFRERRGSENPDAAVLIWNGTYFDYHSLYGGSLKLGNLLSIIGFRREEFDGPAELLERRFPGDWIIRRDKSKEASLKAFEDILNDQFGAKVRFSKQMMDREVIVARGKFEYHPLPVSISYNLELEDHNKTSEKRIHIYANPEERHITGTGGPHPVVSMLDLVSEWTNWPMIMDADTAARGDFWLLCHIQRRPSVPIDPQTLDKVLANLSRQTSLQFIKERRRMEVWQVTQR